MKIAMKQFEALVAGDKGKFPVWNSTAGLYVPEFPSLRSAGVSAADAQSKTGATWATMPNMTISGLDTANGAGVLFYGVLTGVGQLRFADNIYNVRNFSVTTKHVILFPRHGQTIMPSTLTLEWYCSSGTIYCYDRALLVVRNWRDSS